MSVHIEWAHARRRPSLIDEDEAADFSDGHGQGLDPGNVALTVGDGTVLEGTREQIAKWLQAGLRLVGAQPIYAVDREYLDELAGRPVTDEQAHRIGEAIPNSSIPDALREVIFAVIGDEGSASRLSYYVSEDYPATGTWSVYSEEYLIAAPDADPIDGSQKLVQAGLPSEQAAEELASELLRRAGQ